MKEGKLLLAGEVDERTPAVTNGLTSHFPMDGSFQQKRATPYGLKVLYQSYNNVANGHTFGKWLANNGANMTQTTDLSTYNTTSIQAYDLILLDCHVWNITGAQFDMLKSFVDAGVSCVAVGNDATTNVFVSSYDKNGSTRAVHDILVNEMSPIGGVSNLYTGAGSGDVYGGITGLQNGAKPLYYRTDMSPNAITGYYYENKEQTAAFYFDQEGLVSLPEFAQKAIMWVANKTNRQIMNNENTFFADGLCVEERTTNLIAANADTFFDTANGWKLQNNSNYTSGIEFNGGSIFGRGNVLRVTDNLGNTTGNTFGGIDISRVTGLKAGVNYTLSIRYKVTGWTTGSVAVWSHQQDTTGTNSTRSDDHPFPQDTYDGKWHTYTATRTIVNGYNAKTIVIGMNKTNKGCTVYVDAIQLEEKNFPTSICAISRGEGEFKLKDVLSPSRGTVVVDVTFFEDNSINGVNGADQYCFGNQIAWNSANIWQFHDIKRWYIRDVDNTQHWLDITKPMIINERSHLVFVYDDTDGTMDVYKNGELVTNGAKKTAMRGKLGYLGRDWTHSGTSTATSYKMCQKIHGLSFYDRPLTQEEAMKLYRKAFNINKAGSIKTHISEQPNAPKDGLLFPLRENGADITGSVFPVSDSNVTYSADGAYIDSATNNCVLNPSGTKVNGSYDTGWDSKLHVGALSVSNWNAGYNGGVTDANIGYHAHWVYEGIDGGPCIKYIDKNSQFKYTVSGASMRQRWLGTSSNSIGSLNTLGWKVGDKITLSLSCRVDTKGKGINLGLYHKNLSNNATFGGSSKTHIINETGVWKRLSHTFTIDSDWDVAQNYNIIYIYGNSGQEGIAWVDDIQIEKSNFDSGFKVGSVAESKLAYKYADLFPPHQTAKFTIIYWAYYKEAGKFSLTGSWPCFYFGLSNSNRPIFSWREVSAATGNVDTQRSVTGASSLAMNRWYMMAVTVDVGSAIHLYVNGGKDGSFTSSFSLTNTPPDFSLNSLNDGDKAYPINGLLKDFMVFKRVLSDQEIEAIYRTHIRSKKFGSTQIQGGIREGQMF